MRSEAVVSVPTDMDPADYAPLLCAGVTVFNSIRKMNISPGELVAVHGLGGLGHLAVQYAAKMGFCIVALSGSATKEKFARELGAAEYIDTSKEKMAEGLQRLGGAALIVSTAPNPKILGELVYGLAPQGKLLLLARRFTHLVSLTGSHELRLLKAFNHRDFFCTSFDANRSNSNLRG